jgi:hypothetical protein
LHQPAQSDGPGDRLEDDQPGACARKRIAAIGDGRIEANEGKERNWKLEKRKWKTESGEY